MSAIVGCDVLASTSLGPDVSAPTVVAFGSLLGSLVVGGSGAGRRPRARGGMAGGAEEI